MKTHILLGASALAMLATSNVAYAQVDDEVIVTATRRAENVQDVPIAVTAIQPEALQKQGVVNIQNLTSVAPSFSTSQAQTSSGTVVLRVRGVGTTSNNIGFESAVGVFIDGAYQSRPGVALGEFVDVERVEVLRGPQGTLFGRNTSAGALNVINVAPDLYEKGGFVNATFGNYDHQSVQGAINVPLAEGKVAARLTGAIRSRNGYISIFDRTGSKIGTSNGADQSMLRAQIGWEGDSGFNGRVIADFSQSSDECCAAIEVKQAGIETAGLFGAVGLGPRGGMVAPNVGLGNSDDDGVQAAVDDLIASSNQVPDPSNEQIGVTAEMEYPINDNIDVVYVGSYRDYTASEKYDSAFSGLDVFNVVDGSDLDIKTMTHELRLQGDAWDGRLSWLVGAYYSKEDIEQVTNFELGEDYGELIGALFFAPTGGVLGPNPLTVFSGIDPSVVSATNAYTQNSESLSFFTHNILDITDQLSLTLGLRYSDESKDGGFNQPAVNNPLCLNILGAIGAGAVPGPLVNNVFGTGCFAFTAPADLPQAAVLPLPRTFNSTFEDDELIYTAKLSYEFTPDMTAYAGFTHGYKSGGFNLDSTAAAGGADPRFASEEVDSWEAGLKTQFMDGRVTLNLAAFLSEFKDFQVLEFTGAQFQTFNVPKAESKGIEIEGVANITDAFTLNGGLTILDASYPDDCATATDALRVQNLCGFELTNAPGEVGLLGATYVLPVKDTMKVTLSGQARYEGDRRTSTQARLVPATPAQLGSTILNPYDVQDSTVKINARAALGDQDDVWAVELWATNLTNEITRGVTINTVLRSDSRSAFIQEPRMFGVTGRRKF